MPGGVEEENFEIVTPSYAEAVADGARAPKTPNNS